MRIRVRVENEILGNSDFWEGDSKDINQIRNIPARIAATRLIKANITIPLSKNASEYRLGMWIAEKMGD